MKSREIGTLELCKHTICGGLNRRDVVGKGKNESEK